MKPLPALTFLLYLIVGHLTIGLNKSTGFGATFADFAALAFLLETFLPAWSRWTLTLSCQCFLKWFLRIGRFLWIAVKKLSLLVLWSRYIETNCKNIFSAYYVFFLKTSMCKMTNCSPFLTISNKVIEKNRIWTISSQLEVVV